MGTSATPTPEHSLVGPPVSPLQDRREDRRGRYGRLYAIPFDPKRLKATGPATKVQDDVYEQQAADQNFFAVSGGGSLGYAPGGVVGNGRRDRGADPVWSRDGREIFFRAGDKMMAVRVTIQPARLVLGKPEVLWEPPFNYGLNSMCGAPGSGSANYDVTANAKRFVMVQEGEHDAPATELRVVLNWMEEVKRLTARRN